MLRHRESWAEEARSPTQGEWARQQREAAAKETRRGVRERGGAGR
jgi:hypothetical protein